MVTEHRPSVFGSPVTAYSVVSTSVRLSGCRWGYRSVCTCGAQTAPGVLVSWGEAMVATRMHFALEQMTVRFGEKYGRELAGRTQDRPGWPFRS